MSTAFTRANAASKLLHGQRQEKAKANHAPTKAPLPRQNAGAKAARNQARTASIEAAATKIAQSKETENMNQIAALNARLAQLEAALAASKKDAAVAKRKATIASKAAPVAAKAPKSAPVAAPVAEPKKETTTVKTVSKPEYVRTAVKLTNLGHGRRETTIDGTKVGVAWNGAANTFTFFCGRRKGSAADRGEAIAQLNVLLSEMGLGAVRA
jgi:hypothetical protein